MSIKAITRQTALIPIRIQMCEHNIDCDKSNSDNVWLRNFPLEQRHGQVYDSCGLLAGQTERPTQCSIRSIGITVVRVNSRLIDRLGRSEPRSDSIHNCARGPGSHLNGFIINTLQKYVFSQ